MKVLMVCLGNICRSPLAEGIFRHKTESMGLGWEVDSAGTSNYHIGEPPHRLSQKVALQNGIDISGQRGRQFKASDMVDFDCIYVMDASNYEDVQKMSGKLWNPNKVMLLLDELYPNKSKDVPDPWYGGYDGFEDVFAMLEKAIDKSIERLIGIEKSNQR